MYFALLSLSLIPLVSVAQPCVPEWNDDFPNADIGTYTLAFAGALAEWNVNGTPTIFAGAKFDRASGFPAHHIAQWDGHRWLPLGQAPDDGVNEQVCDLLVHDDGSGEMLWVAGKFTKAGGNSVAFIARWNGSAWVPTPGTNKDVNALESFDNLLFAGGAFGKAAGKIAPFLATWNGVYWSPAPGSFNNTVHCLRAADLGQGPRLFAGGDFTSAGGPSLQRIAEFDGAQWKPLGDGFNARVRAIREATLQGVTSLYATGDFTATGSIPIQQIARWDGSTWSPLAEGLYNAQGGWALEFHDDGNGPALFVGGELKNPGNNSAGGVVRWDGTSWSALGNGIIGYGVEVLGLLSASDAFASRLFVLGDFTFVEYNEKSLQASRIATWGSDGWRRLAHAPGSSNGGLAVLDQGSGPNLYASARVADGHLCGGLARWNGSAWDCVASGTTQGQPSTMLAADLGDGPTIYVGGQYLPGHVAKWNGTSLVPLGDLEGIAVRALQTWNDGTGLSLYAAGDVWTNESPQAPHLCRWTGDQWTVVPGPVQSVHALQAFSSGPNSALYVAGTFSIAGSVAANNIARWTGFKWQPLGAGLSGSLSPIVNSLQVFDDGSGPALYAGGNITQSGSLPINAIAKWNGFTWSSLAAGCDWTVSALATSPPGWTPELFAAGKFTQAGGAPAWRIAAWNGTSWRPIALTGAGDELLSILPAPAIGPVGPSLYTRGSFVAIDNASADYIARFGCPISNCAADCDSNATLDINDFVCFQTAFALGMPSADCDGNASLNIDDFVCFQTLFAIGC